MTVSRTKKSARCVPTEPLRSQLKPPGRAAAHAADERRLGRRAPRLRREAAGEQLLEREVAEQLQIVVDVRVAPHLRTVGADVRVAGRDERHRVPAGGGPVGRVRVAVALVLVSGAVTVRLDSVWVCSVERQDHVSTQGASSADSSKKTVPIGYGESTRSTESSSPVRVPESRTGPAVARYELPVRFGRSGATLVLKTRRRRPVGVRGQRGAASVVSVPDRTCR